MSGTGYWSYPILPFGIVACTIFPTTFLEIAVYKWCSLTTWPSAYLYYHVRRLSLFCRTFWSTSYVGRATYEQSTWWIRLLLLVCRAYTDKNQACNSAKIRPTWMDLILTLQQRLLSLRWAHELGRGPLHSSSLLIPSPSIASKVFRTLFLLFRIPVNYSRGDLLLGLLGNLTIDLKLN